MLFWLWYSECIMDILFHLVATGAMGPSQVDPRDLSPGGREVCLLFIWKRKSKEVSKVLSLLLLVPFAASAGMTTHSRRCNCIREEDDKALRAGTSLFAADMSTDFMPLFIPLQSINGGRPPPHFMYDPSTFAFRSLSTLKPLSPIAPVEEPSCAY